MQIINKHVRRCSTSLIAVIQFLSYVRLSATPWTVACQTRPPCHSLSPGVCLNSCPLSGWYFLTISSSATRFSFCLQSFPVSGSFPRSQLFASSDQSNWSFSFSYRPSNDYSELISFGINWFDLVALQGTPRSLLEHHSSKASVLLCSASFMVQFSHPYLTTGKTIVLSIWTFVGKVMSLPLNTLSRCVIAFLPRSKHLLISWLQSLLHMALSILWIFGSLSLPILDLPGCATFLPRSAPIISVVMKKSSFKCLWR